MTIYLDPGEQPPSKRRKAKTMEFAPNLFEMPYDAPAPSVPRPTSEDAADRQSRSKRQIDRTRILRAVAFTRDGLTRDQIAEELAISPNTVRPRIVELVTLGFVHDERLTRLTQTGSSAAVCEATDAGRVWLDDNRLETP